MPQGQNGLRPERHIEGMLLPMPKQAKVKLEDAGVTKRQIQTGLRLRAIRKLAGFNQGPIAELCGADQSQWSRWEKGERPAEVEVMRRFARRAKTSLDLIYDGLPVGTDPTLLRLLRVKIPELLQSDPTYMDQDTDTAQASYRKSIRREGEGS